MKYYTKVKNVLTNYSNKSKAPRSNISKEQKEALYNLKKYNNHMIFTADKGVVLVVMDKDMYIEKFMRLLSAPKCIPRVQGPHQVHSQQGHKTTF